MKKYNIRRSLLLSLISVPILTTILECTNIKYTNTSNIINTTAQEEKNGLTPDHSHVAKGNASSNLGTAKVPALNLEVIQKNKSSHPCSSRSEWDPQNNVTTTPKNHNTKHSSNISEYSYNLKSQKINYYEIRLENLRQELKAELSEDLRQELKAELLENLKQELSQKFDEKIQKLEQNCLDLNDKVNQNSRGLVIRILDVPKQLLFSWITNNIYRLG